MTERGPTQRNLGKYLVTGNPISNVANGRLHW